MSDRILFSLECVRLDPGLIDERKTARRAGSKHEFGTADHLPGAPMDAMDKNYKGAEPNGIGPYSQPERALASFIPAAWPSETLADARRQLVAYLSVGVEPLFAAALRPRRVDHRPIFHLGRNRAGQFQRPNNPCNDVNKSQYDK